MKNALCELLNPKKSHKETCIVVLIDFLLTVKVASLIFISGRGSAISILMEGKSGFIYNLVRNNKLCGPRKRACIS